MRLTLGPVLFNWAPDAWRDFHFRIADEAPIDRVLIGEVVCSKRSPFFAEHLPAVAERLADAGKEVVFASLALVTLIVKVVLERLTQRQLQEANVELSQGELS